MPSVSMLAYLTEREHVAEGSEDRKSKSSHREQVQEVQPKREQVQPKREQVLPQTVFSTSKYSLRGR